MTSFKFKMYSLQLQTSPVSMGFVVDKLALGFFFLQVFLFCPVTFHQCSIVRHLSITHIV